MMARSAYDPSGAAVNAGERPWRDAGVRREQGREAPTQGDLLLAESPELGQRRAA
jgi:hypothetical protein